MKVHSILLAGGSSDRFNNEENKVYYPIGGKPALSWALEPLDNSAKVDSILLVVPMLAVNFIQDNSSLFLSTLLVCAYSFRHSKIDKNISNN